MSLKELSEAVESDDRDKYEALARELLVEGADPLQTISSLTVVVEIFEPKLQELKSESGKGKLVLSTVKGDLHEIGKNLVKLMLESNGFQIKDLGCDGTCSEELYYSMCLAFCRNLSWTVSALRSWKTRSV